MYYYMYIEWLNQKQKKIECVLETILQLQNA